VKRPAAACLILVSVLAARATGADAPPCRYTIPGDGTVIDTKTKLVWEQAEGDATGSLDWPAAKQFCATLRLGGPEHWRLPTIKELFTLVDVSAEFMTTPRYFAIDEGVFATPSNALWSSTPEPGTAATGKAFAWALYFDGSTQPVDTSMFGLGVRCVR
jgi:hypothetical protein